LLLVLTTISLFHLPWAFVFSFYLKNFSSECLLVNCSFEKRRAATVALFRGACRTCAATPGVRAAPIAVAGAAFAIAHRFPTLGAKMVGPKNVLPLITIL